MRITMVGTGYVGLVSGACFADFGHQVICVDKNADKIAALRRSEIPIFEPDLDRLVEANVGATPFLAGGVEIMSADARHDRIKLQII